MLATTQAIFDSFFDSTEKLRINEIIKELKKKYYNSDNLWKFDQTIGGIGGYCMPINPTICCFQGTEVRNVYRSYQYARSKIDMCDINYFAREVIRDSGLGLEFLLKLVLRRKSVIDRIKIDFDVNVPLGALINRTEKKRWLDESTINELKMMLNCYNDSKHSINHKGRKRTFNTEDAIIYYLASRKIGIKLLKGLDTDLTKGLASLTFDIIYKRKNYMHIKDISIDGKILYLKKKTIIRGKLEKVN